MKEVFGVKYLESHEVCNSLKISESTLRRWRDSGKISCVKVSERIFLYPETSVKLFLENAINNATNKSVIMDGSRKDDRRSIL